MQTCKGPRVRATNHIGLAAHLLSCATQGAAAGQVSAGPLPRDMNEHTIGSSTARLLTPQLFASGWAVKRGEARKMKNKEQKGLLFYWASLYAVYGKQHPDLPTIPEQVRQLNRLNRRPTF